VRTKTFGGIAILIAYASVAFGYPRLSLEGDGEDIPKFVSASTLVCKGEVLYAPELIFVENPPRMTATASVGLDRCFKGSAMGTIDVLFDGFLPSGGSSGGWSPLILTTGDYDLFFLKPQGGKYVPVDQRNGALRISREMGPTAKGSDPLLQLELDLKAGLHDAEPELVLASIRILGSMKHLHSIAELRALLDSPDLLEKTYVWEALLKLKNYSVLPAVTEFFATQPEAPRNLFLPRDRLFQMEDCSIRLGRFMIRLLCPISRSLPSRQNSACEWKHCRHFVRLRTHAAPQLS